MVVESLLVIAATILLFSAFSRHAERMPLTLPMFFIAAGCLVSEHGLGLLEADVTGEFIHFLAELAPAVVLFTDASRIDVPLL
jgi:NhaP-type Na+/H+ and K+/H+ antiporter